MGRAFILLCVGEAIKPLCHKVIQTQGVLGLSREDASRAGIAQPFFLTDCSVSPVARLDPSHFFMTRLFFKQWRISCKNPPQANGCKKNSQKGWSADCKKTKKKQYHSMLRIFILLE